MLEVLNFIFRDFWTFCGVVILLCVIGVYCITAPISAIACIFNKKTDEKEKKDMKDYLEKRNQNVTELYEKMKELIGTVLERI